MEVIAWSQNLDAERASRAGAKRVERDELLARADAVTIHLVLSERTRGLIGERELARMKPTAFLDQHLARPDRRRGRARRGAERRAIAGAGLDVYDDEPLPLDHPLPPLENVVLTPHLGYVTRESYRVYSRRGRGHPRLARRQAGAGDERGVIYGDRASSGARAWLPELTVTSTSMPR